MAQEQRRITKNNMTYSTSKINQLLLFGLLILLPIHLAPAQAPQAVYVSLGGGFLNSGNDGKIKIRTGAESFEDVQLSSRYFSDSVKISGDRSIHIYSPGDDPSEQSPTTKIKLPSSGKNFLVFLWQKRGSNNKRPVYQARVISKNNWPQGSMLLINATSSKLGLVFGKDKQIIQKNKTTILKGQKPALSKPAKIMVAQKDNPQKSKLVFSSTWRISPHRRELCVIYQTGAKIKFRSLFERVSPSPAVDLSGTP